MNKLVLAYFLFQDVKEVEACRQYLRETGNVTRFFKAKTGGYVVTAEWKVASREQLEDSQEKAAQIVWKGQRPKVVVSRPNLTQEDRENAVRASYRKYEAENPNALPRKRTYNASEKGKAAKKRYRDKKRAERLAALEQNGLAYKR